MRKTAMAMIVTSLFGATAVCVAQSADVSGSVTICFYNQCAYYDGTSSNQEVIFMFFQPGQPKPSGAYWNIVPRGHVQDGPSTYWPFTLGTGLNSQFVNYQVVEIERNVDPYLAVGGCNSNYFIGCTQPTQSNNYQVLVPQGGNNYRIIDVYASNKQGSRISWNYLDQDGPLEYESGFGNVLTLAPQ